MRAARLILLPLAVAAAWPVPVLAHPGGLNSAGCHNNRKTGDYHCHRASLPESSYGSARSDRGGGGSAPFPNCAAARAAGAAPVYRNDPGYSRRLDRDGDGKGCE